MRPCTLLLVGMQSGSATMENSTAVPQHIRTTLQSSNPTPGYVAEGKENGVSKRYIHSCAALFKIVKIWK